MSNLSVENLDDEELLALYEETFKLLEARKGQEGESSPKCQTTQQKLTFLEDELKFRSLWEGE